MPGETPKIYISHIVASTLSHLKLATYLDTLDISVPAERFGDYSTNAALVIAKKLKRNPVEVAGEMVEMMKSLDSKKLLAEINAVGGFINFKFGPSVPADNSFQFAQGVNLGLSASLGAGKKVLFEYSSPNTNKALHIGHTRNDVYGMACINLLKATGHEVIASEVINDRGIHIMKSMLMYQKFGENKTPELENIKPDHFVGKFYAMFAEKAAESEAKEKELMEEAQSLLQKWEAGDTDIRNLWQTMNSWWYEGVKQTYQREGSSFDELDYESQIYDKGRDIVLEGVKKGVFKQEEDGSVSVDLTPYKLDKKYLLRKDGTTIYITQDLYLWHLRNEKHHPNVAIVTTAAEQAYHFAVLNKLFELLEYPWAKTFRHLPYEHVFLGHDKMSSRGGNTVSADDLVKMIKDKVVSVMGSLEKTKQSASNQELVEQVAFGAIKYGYLKYEPNTRIYFDIDQTIALEGNTGPYIQYAHARMKSIVRKAGDVQLLRPTDLTLPEEVALMRQLLYYPEVVEFAAQEYKPNLLCNYLYELASASNSFYHASPVLNAESVTLKHQRLTLLTAAANTIKQGLGLLGIEAPEEM